MNDNHLFKEPTAQRIRSPWQWVPSLYFAEGLPYAMIMTVSVIFYKRMGVSNGDIAFYTGWLYLPWVIKPLWSPVVDMLKTKRWWITIMQLLLGAGFGCVALTIPLPAFFQMTLLFFWLAAFSSATHDIAADGFYILGLNDNQQSLFVGIRSTFYRIAMIAGQGALVMLAGRLEIVTGNIPLSWSFAFAGVALLMLLAGIYHLWALPKPNSDRSVRISGPFWGGFAQTFVTFFQKRDIGLTLSFLLLFRLAESQLVKMASPFLLDSPQNGGLGIDTQTVGFIYGTVGLIALSVGGVLGGLAASRHGLKHWLWWMTMAINVPNLVYVYMAYWQPQNLWLISTCVTIEQFGYGFGFTAFMLYMIYYSEGESQTAHFALCTGFMALGMMIPGMISGWIQELLGYQYFFIWVIICTIPGFILVKSIDVHQDFGKSQNRNH